MPEATLSSKYQVTVPMEIVRALGLKGGDKLVLTQVEDRIVMLPKPANWADYWTGRLKGGYGESKREIDHYIAEERASWGGPDERAQQLKSLLALDPVARKVYRELNRGPRGRDSLDKSLDLTGKGLDRALTNLTGVGAVRTIKVEPEPSLGDRWLYEAV